MKPGCLCWLSQIIVVSVFISVNRAQEYTVGNWTVAGALDVATTQFYGAVDPATSTVYITGGLVSDTQAKNLVESITFDINDDALTIKSEHVTNLFIAELGLQWGLSPWYGRQQSSGFYDDSLYIIEPIYEANPEEHYFLKCDISSKSCSFEPSDKLTSHEPCISQRDHFLYISGGIEPSNVATSQQINIYSMEDGQWTINSMGPLAIGQVYHSCAVCGDHLYTFGGDIGDDTANNSESYTGIIQKCSIEGGECTIMDIAYNAVRYSRAVTINDNVIVIAGGRYSSDVYSQNVDIFDCRTEEISAGPHLPSPLAEFQMGSLFNDSFICIFGGQTIEEQIFKISAEILCAPVIQDGVPRYTFAAPQIEENQETFPPTQGPSDVIPSSQVDSKPHDSSDRTVRPTTKPTIAPTIVDQQSETPTKVDNQTNAESPEVIEENEPGNEFFDEFEEESNSNAEVIYGVIFGIIVVVVCITVFVIYKEKKKREKPTVRVGIREDAVEKNFVVANIDDRDSDSDSDELGIGHRQSNRAWGGSHSVVESGVGDTDEESYGQYEDETVGMGVVDYR